MATMAAVSSSTDRSSNNDTDSNFQVNPSPSKKCKIEPNDNDVTSNDEGRQEPVVETFLEQEDQQTVKIKVERERTRARKKPTLLYRVGDMFTGLIGHANPEVKKEELTEEDEEYERPRSASSVSASVTSDIGSAGSSEQRVPKYEREYDPATLDRRRKQIDYGKNTPEYDTYTKSVPREKREAYHPRTPNMRRKYSRRAWDGLIRQWRKNLHLWHNNPDPNEVSVDKKEFSWFEETEDYYKDDDEDDDDDDEDNIHVTV